MVTSILDSIKLKLDVDLDETVFDEEILMSINAALMVLNQLGVGVDNFTVTGKNETWDDFLADTSDHYGAIEDYVYFKTKLAFNPPTNSFLVNSISDTLKEYEWRLNTQVEYNKTNSTTTTD